MANQKQLAQCYIPPAYIPTKCQDKNTELLLSSEPITIIKISILYTLKDFGFFFRFAKKISKRRKIITTEIGIPRTVLAVIENDCQSLTRQYSIYIAWYDIVFMYIYSITTTAIYTMHWIFNKKIA